ncbi:MAG: hypothetical protein KF862_01100 [Chitinophagaceae bacterium]|nr:hypothetical protein [Chitinophagaceae bacterium]
MKNFLLLITILSFTQIGCKKSSITDTVPRSLNGKWRMIIVKDNASGLTTTKPTSIQNDVDITFTSSDSTSGTFFGNTPTNEIEKSDFLIGANQTITIPALAMTKIAETAWGIEFVNNICSSQKYSFEFGGRLTITTTNNTLTFQKQ